jgi:hypothetical protein
MKQKVDLQQLLSRWAGLGIAFARRRKKDEDIEQTIIDTLPHLRDDLKLLQLLLTWLQQMGDLVHVERLKALAKTLDLTDLAFLGAIAEFTKTEFRSWELISNYSFKTLQSQYKSGFKPEVSEKVSLAVDYNRTEVDPAFSKFHLKVPMIELADTKKLIPRKYILEDHRWLGFRALFGSNWRADIAYLIVTKASANAHQIASRLGCSYETAYRLKKALDEAPLRRLA